MIYSWKPNKCSDIPLHIQVSSYLESLINSGTLLPGDHLPGQRRLVELFEVSRTTIITAFEQLKNMGLVIAKPQSGYVVAPAKYSEGSLPNWDIYTKRAKYRPGSKDFRMWSDMGGLAGFALSEDFSFVKYLKKVRNSINSLDNPKRQKLFTKHGFQPLRESVAKHLATIGITTAAENVLICSSTFTATSIIYSGLTSLGSNFIYEKPNLVNTVTDIHSIGLNMIGVAMDKNGISSSDLKRILPRHRSPVLHLDPCDQVPTGIVMSKNRKREILELSRTYRIPVIEIEHIRDAWHDKPFPAPMKSMEGGGNVIYMGSFIRSHPVDFRICWIVADRRMIEHLSEVQIQADDRPSIVMQALANELFETGIYYSMMEDIRGFIRKRKELALDLCHKYLKNIAVWNDRNCGFNFWLNFPDNNIHAVFKRGHVENCYPGYFFDRDDSSHILFCPSSLIEEEIPKTINMFSEKFR